MQMLINIDVDDLERAIEFYTAGIGLRLSRRLFEGTVAELCGGTARIQLLLKSAGSAPAASVAGARRYDRHWTPVHLDFVVEDVSMAVERAVRAGAILEGAVQSHAWGRLAAMSDPFGHGFCLVQFLERGYEEAA